MVGAGAHGRVVADALIASRRRVAAFSDRQTAGQTLGGTPVISNDLSTLQRESARLAAPVVVAIGDNATRARVQAELVACGIELTSVIHPTAVMLSGARLGRGVMVLAGAIIGIDTVVGDGAILNTAVSVDHDNRLGDYVHLSPGVHTGGDVTLGVGTHLAVGVSVRNGVKIGDWCVIGVGAAVVGDLPSRIVAVGVPARIRPSAAD